MVVSSTSSEREILDNRSAILHLLRDRLQACPNSD